MSSTARFLFEVGALESTPRSGYALLRVAPQSVAAHSYRQAMIAFVLARSMSGVDLGRALTMCLVHDLPETRTGDLHHLAQRYARVDDAAVLADQTHDLDTAEEIRELYEEYRAGQTIEARVVKDADQLELLLGLRERGQVDDPEVAAWIERAQERLKTPEAQALARQIERGEPRWWL